MDPQGPRQYRRLVRQPVKYRPVFALLGVVVAAVVCREAGAQSARRAAPGPLLGGSWGPPPERPPAPVDPRLPTGAALPTAFDRPKGHRRACSGRRPVCVHAARDVPDRTAAEALRALESGYERVVLALGLPDPLDDRGGGSRDLDWYVGRDGPRQLIVERDEVRLSSRFDSAPAFCIGTGVADGDLERDAVLCVAEALAWRLDAAETPHSKRAFAAHVWHVVGLPTNADLAAVDDAQSNPQRTPSAAARSRYSEGDALFLDVLDARHSAAFPGSLAASLLALSAAETPASARAWNNEPDSVDVIRHTFGDRAARFADLLVDAAVDRAWLGSRSDGTRLPDWDHAGDFGRVRFDWAVKLSSMPRNLAPMRPIESLGSTYVWIDVDEVNLGEGLGFRAEWESPVAFRWTVLSLDRDGSVISRLDVPFLERGTSVEGRVVDVSSAAALVVVGVNVGGTSLAHPFDPDMEPDEPHGYTLLLAKI